MQYKKMYVANIAITLKAYFFVKKTCHNAIYLLKTVCQ